MLGASMNLFATAAIVGIAASSASAMDLSTKTVSKTYGDWVVTSSQSYQGTEVIAIATHFNLFRKVGRQLVHSGQFTGTIAGDGGEFWETRYEFRISSASTMHVNETKRSFRPVWGIDDTGDVGFFEIEYRELKSSEGGFVEVSSRTAVGLTRGTSETILPAKVSGMLYSDRQAELGFAENMTAEVIDYTWSHEIRVRLADGREGFVAENAVAVPGRARKNK
jgi:hypothetical protein